METTSNSNVTAINSSNDRDDGSTAQRLNRSNSNFGFRSSVYSDVIERLKTVGKNQSGVAKL